MIPELDEEEKHLLGRFSAFRAIYIRNTCTYLFKTECAWDKLDYSSVHKYLIVECTDYRASFCYRQLGEAVGNTFKIYGRNGPRD